MRISLFRHWRDNAPVPVDLTFAEFCAELGTDPAPPHLTQPDADKRKTPAFSPVEFEDSKPRKDEFARAVHALALDFDGADKKGEPEEGVAKLLQALEGNSFVACSSFSHAETFASTGKYKFRVVVELSRPVLASEWRTFWRRATSLLPIPYDTQCVNEARIYGLPLMRSEHDFVQRYEGAPLDVDAVLREVRDPEEGRAAVAAARSASLVTEAVLDPKEVRKLANKWAKSEHPETAKRGRLTHLLLERKPYATGKTGRHETARELTIMLERSFPTASVEAITGLFRGSVVSMAADDPEWDIDTRMADIERLIEGAREMRLEDEAERQALAESEARARVKAARVDGKDTTYTKAELAEIAAVQGCRVDELDHRWIICRGQGFYFLRQDGYVGPYSPTGFTSAVRDWLAPAELEVERPTREEGWKSRGVSELMKDYGTEALKVVASMYAERSTFDGATSTITEAVCRLRELDDSWHPEFAKIQRYVELLGGVHHEKLKDWLATCTDLSRPTCALYFSGASGSGKSLFMSAISRLYTTGAPSLLKDAFSNFNDTILNCPFLVTDDSPLPPSVTSGDIREIIGVIARPLKRKYMPSAELQGAVRIIIGANRDDVLSFNETLSTDELDATAQRIMHIVTTDESRRYLLENNHRHWVTEDLFARYVLWLRKNRRVDSTGRWLVEGHMPEMRAKLATSGPNARFCEWIVGYLSDEAARMKNTAQAACVQLREGMDASGTGNGVGELWINAQAISHQWDAYTIELGRNDRPAPERASMALKGLSTAHKSFKVKVGAKASVLQFWRINLDHVFDWAVRSGTGDVEQMRAYVGRSVTATAKSATAPVK